MDYELDNKLQRMLVLAFKIYLDASRYTVRVSDAGTSESRISSIICGL